MHLKHEALHFVSAHSESVLQRAEALELDGELGEQVSWFRNRRLCARLCCRLCIRLGIVLI